MAHDYVNIGLSYVAKEDGTVARELLQTTQIRPFFQTGWGLLQRLQQQAGLMATQLDESGLSEWESYLDPPFREMYTGVRRKEPLFFVGLKTPGEIVSRRFGQLSRDSTGRIAAGPDPDLVLGLPALVHITRRKGA